MIIHSDVNCSETNQYEVENNCLVCHDTIKEEDKVVLKCGHKYHYNCIFMIKIDKQCNKKSKYYQFII